MCHKTTIFALALLFLFSFSRCTENDSNTVTSSARCVLKDLGEAANLFEKADSQIPDNQFVKTEGISGNKTMIINDAKTNETFFVTKVMGCEGRLFYKKKLEKGKRPGFLSFFQGTIRRWDQLPKHDGPAMARAMEKQLQIKINPKTTFIILADEKPEGCQ